MFGGDRDLDTICAISTPPGVGGIHIIRVSGKEALKMVRPMAPFLPEKLESHKIYFGTLISSVGNINSKEPIDEVLLSYFKNGSSFTGEETVEISCHGSPFIAQQIMKQVTFHGARVADRGEFTYRSFLNGKVDLIQAESVLSLIQSENEKSLKVAIQQLKGGLSEKINSIKQDIIALLARLEVAIDFTTEDVEIISNADVINRINKIHEPILSLLNSFKSGHKIHSGFEVVLVGEPNVGKSSLLNRVLFEERAIVTDIPGTTRDLIQEQIHVKGVKVTLTDSAGIRESEDLIEQMGVSKTKKAIQQADLIFAVYDVTRPKFGSLISQLPTELSKIIFVGNKSDLINQQQQKDILQDLQNLLIQLYKFQNKTEAETFIQTRCIFTSALMDPTQDPGVIQHQILQMIEQHLDTGSFGDEAILFQSRHYEHLQRTSECLLRAKLLVESSSSPEFLALEVKESLIRIQEILGERFDDQILDRVFSEFCIGK